jgi:hypothetical protein
MLSLIVVISFLLRITVGLTVAFLLPLVYEVRLPKSASSTSDFLVDIILGPLLFLELPDLTDYAHYTAPYH